MDGIKDDPSATATQSHVINHYWNKLGAEIDILLSNESRHLEVIRDLSMELSAFKSAFSLSEQNKREVEEERNKLRRELENQVIALKGSERRVVCLIDGDGTIFTNDLIARGQEGGYAAAQSLTEATQKYLLSNYSLDQFQLWTYIFYNKRGLFETLSRAGLWQAKAKLDDFMIGFNQAAGRFSMVDVGSGKEMADAKIKVHLEDNVRLPQTFKVIFGCCHDNGYVTNLRSVITDGFQNKLILLRGYMEMAAGIDELGLPCMTIDDLFMTQKLVIAPRPSTPNLPAPLMSVGSINMPQIYPNKASDITSAPELPPGVGQCDTMARVPSPPPRYNSPSYSSALQAVISSNRASTDSDSSAASDISDDLPIKPRSSSTTTKPRLPNPRLPLTKHKPAPCTLFYLASCKHGADCRYGHDYLLQDEHYEEMRLNAKKGPCPALNRGDECTWGDGCIYGHLCPEGVHCRFKAQDRCRFSGGDMHKDTNLAR